MSDQNQVSPDKTQPDSSGSQDPTKQPPSLTPDQKGAAPPSSNQAGPRPGSDKILLLIEDDPLLINMYQTKFTAEGFKVFTATDGQAGLDMAKSQKPSIIILDIMMPKLDGIEVLRQLRQDANLKQVPVLMLTNLSGMDKQKEAMALGAKEFIIKANLTPTQVVQKIKQHLGMAQ